MNRIVVSLVAGILSGSLVGAVPIDYVDPLIGSVAEGNTFPGVSTPFGMIQASPDTVGRNRVSGYKHTDTRIRGFSQTHLNGTGCGGLGDLLLMPFGEEKVRGEGKKVNGKGEGEGKGVFSNAEISSAFSKERQFCEVDRYRVHLDDFDVDVEATASPRVGWWRFTWNGEGPKRLLVDAASTILLAWAPQYGPWIPESEMGFSADRTEIFGSRRVKGWAEYKLHYVVKLDRPFAARRMMKRDPFEGKGDRVVLDFDSEKVEKAGGENRGWTLGVRVALSLKSVESARRNLEAESRGKTFEQVRAETRARWADVLSRMTAEGGRAADLKSFYTALYHLFQQPNLISDVGEEEEYSTFSLWDTFRAAHPLYTIVAPEKVPAFVRSMMKHGKRHGHLPMWEFWGEETHCMIGWPAIPVVVDAYLKGLVGTKVSGEGEGMGDEILSQVIDTLTRCDERHPQMNNILWTYGYFPCDRGMFDVNYKPGESVSRTLEIAYDWWCADALARRLGNDRAVRGCARYVNCWKNLWDKETGYMRPKDSHGRWLAPFTPTRGREPGRDWPEYCEANACIYTWHVFQDPDALAELMGGRAAALKRLDDFFGRETSAHSKDTRFRISGQRGEFWHGNEPSHHIPYLYAVWGEPAKTRALVKQILTEYYEPVPDGLCGNDDCGQMSAWYLFSAAGFYPLNPCGGEYVTGAPLFRKVTFRLPGGKTFVVNDLRKDRDPLAPCTVPAKIRHADVMRGGELNFR